MAENAKYHLGKFSFDTKEEYDAAVKELNFIKLIMSKADINKPANAKIVIQGIRDGKIKFTTSVGKAFVKRLEGIAGEKVYKSATSKVVSQAANKTAATVKAAGRQLKSSIQDATDDAKEEIEYNIIGEKSSAHSKTTALLFMLSFVLVLILSYMGFNHFLYPLIVLIELILGCSFWQNAKKNVKEMEGIASLSAKAEILSWVIPILVCIPFCVCPLLVIILVGIQIYEKASGEGQWILGNLLHGLFFVLIQLLYIFNIRMGRIICIRDYTALGAILGRTLLLILFAGISLLFSAVLMIVMCKVLKSQFALALRYSFSYPLEVSSCLILWLVARKEFFKKAAETAGEVFEGFCILALVLTCIGGGVFLIGNLAPVLFPPTIAVSGYTRRNPHGGYTYVKAHHRTVADGIKWNNLSH